MNLIDQAFKHALSGDCQALQDVLLAMTIEEIKQVSVAGGLLHAFGVVETVYKNSGL